MTIPENDEHNLAASDFLRQAENWLVAGMGLEERGDQDGARMNFHRAHEFAGLAEAARGRSPLTGKYPHLESTDAEYVRQIARDAEKGIRRTAAGNPNTTEHRGEANRLITQAQKAYKSAETAEERGRPWQEAFDSYLTALVWAMMAYQEAEHGTPKKSRKRGARRMASTVRSTEQYAIFIAQGSLVALRGMVTAAKKQGRGKASLAAVGNPANIPGGNMAECIAIMEARGDVESPGALCNWLSRKAGERRGGRAGSRPKGTAKARGILQRAMRGT